MSLLFLLLVGEALAGGGSAPWPLSVGIWNSIPAAAAFGMAAVLTLDRLIHTILGPARTCLAAALVFMPVVPVVSPWSPLHDAAWSAAVICGGLGLATRSRGTAWVLAMMAWAVWWLGPASIGHLGRAVVLAGLAAAALVAAPIPRRCPSVSNTGSSG